MLGFSIITGKDAWKKVGRKQLPTSLPPASTNAEKCAWGRTEMELIADLRTENQSQNAMLQQLQQSTQKCMERVGIVMQQVNHCLGHWHFRNRCQFKVWLIHFQCNSQLKHRGKQQMVAWVTAIVTPTWVIRVEFHVPGLGLEPCDHLELSSGWKTFISV